MNSSPCPFCGQSLQAHINAETGKPFQKPVEGDLTICHKCSHLAIHRGDAWAKLQEEDMPEVCRGIESVKLASLIIALKIASGQMQITSDSMHVKAEAIIREAAGLDPEQCRFECNANAEADLEIQPKFEEVSDKEETQDGVLRRIIGIKCRKIKKTEENSPPPPPVGDPLNPWSGFTDWTRSSKNS